MESVSCIAKNETNDSFVDWATFASVEHRRYSFTFLNLTHLTYLTFTNFSSTFPRNDINMEFTFINGLDEIGENAFQELNYYSNEPIDLTFTSPRNFQLADYAFGRAHYFEIIIENIQYSPIHNRPYRFNLKSMDGIKFYQMSIINSGEIYFVSNGTTFIELTEISVVNCSLLNASLLIDSLSTSIADLNLSSNRLTEIPSMMRFQEMRDINLKNNFIEEITENIFNNMPNLFELDLSNNRIRTIASDSFVGLNFLVTLALDNNLLKSLETISNDNRTVSFLHPLDQMLAFFSASNNFIEDLNPLKYMINLDNLTLCWNRIKRLEGNTFDQGTNLRTLDLSFNQIEYIDSMAFNGTIVNDLNLAGNPFSSMETTVQDNQNQTTSFLYPISSTIFSLSLSNCMNLIEINWFVISKMQILSNFELSQLNKTAQFWLYRQTDINSEESIINWGFPPHIILNNIRFTDNDYCLTKPIDHILNRTTLTVDIDHPCNCFIFKFKGIYDQDQRPICLFNDSIVNQLSNQCSNMDSYCESFLNGTTSSSSSPMDTSTTPRFTSTATVTASVNTTTTNVQISSSAVTTITQTPLKRSNKNQQTKLILATTIPILVIIISFLTVVYISKRKKKNNLGENFEMKLNNPMYKS